MRGSIENIAVLRHLLADRFPSVPARSATVLPTGIAALDDAAGGGLPAGAITEIVSTQPSSGGQLILLRLLEVVRAARGRAALIDGTDAFDPDSHEPAQLQHLVWARCRTLEEALAAADILAHDANLALLMLDLRGFEPADLRQAPAATWYRLQRTIARGDTVMAVFTVWPLADSAVLRFRLPQAFALGQLQDPQAKLWQELVAEKHRSRLQLEKRTA
ncbi:MAG TPA: hypothetical protein VG838_09760 [Opitutaceae bacterium]|nr:hypothetical protein [Opitutaceae bacterium]